jgi:glutamate/tyrosine decarboxylase-like PLP-dependent enzyme
MSLDPDPESLRRFGHAAVDRIVDRLTGLTEHRVFSRPDPAHLAARLREPAPELGAGFHACLDRFFDEILPAATLVNHPRFFGWVPGPGSQIGALGAYLAAATNLFVGSWLGGASLAQLEVEVLRWLAAALGLPVETPGLFTSGGSLANLAALSAARARASARGAERFVVYLGDQAHGSNHKAARVIGVPVDAIRRVRTDSRQRIDPGDLARQLEADAGAGRVGAAIVTSLGTTSTGAIDPIDAIAAIADAAGAWLHVDGAYGAAAALLPERTDLRAALARADSITLDPHKWLYVPFECGCLLMRDLSALHAAFTTDGAYLQDIPRDAVNFFDRGPELSRGARALPVWFLLRAVGLDAVRTAIRDDLAHAQRAQDRLAADPRIRIVTERSLSVFTFDVAGDEARTRALLDALWADGTTMLSSSLVDGRFVLRFCVVNHRTTAAEIDRAVATILRLLD